MQTKALIWTILKVDSFQSYNKLIFLLQKLPLIGKKVPNHWYKATDIKLMVLFYQLVNRFFFGLLKSVIYMIFCFTVSSLLIEVLKKISIAPQSQFSMMLTIMILFSLILSSPIHLELIKFGDMRQFHFIRLMRLEPRTYFLVNELFEAVESLCFKSLVFGFFFSLHHFSFWHGLTFALLIIGSRLGVKLLFLPCYDRVRSEKHLKTLQTKVSLSLCFLTVVLSVFILFLGRYFSPYPFYSWYAGIIGFGLWSVSFLRLKVYPNINSLTRRVLTHESMKEYIALIDSATTLAVKVEDEDYDVNDFSSQGLEQLSGIPYLNAIFMKRMGKEFRKNIRNRLLFIGFIWLMELLVIYFFNDQFRISAHSNAFPKLIFVAIITGYLTYIGESYVKFCFYHLDRPLLKFNDYRTKEVILQLLKIRFVTALKQNIPIFLALNLVYITYYLAFFDSQFWEILVIILSQLISMTFFSLYFLYLYFLLQPYTEGLVSKSYSYNILSFLVYFLGYMGFKILALIDSEKVMAFLLILVLIVVLGYWAVMQFATKTFRLKK